MAVVGAKTEAHSFIIPNLKQVLQILNLDKLISWSRRTRFTMTTANISTNRSRRQKSHRRHHHRRHGDELDAAKCRNRAAPLTQALRVSPLSPNQSNPSTGSANKPNGLRNRLVDWLNSGLSVINWGPILQSISKSAHKAILPALAHVTRFEDEPPSAFGRNQSPADTARLLPGMSYKTTTGSTVHCHTKLTVARDISTNISAAALGRTASTQILWPTLTAANPTTETFLEGTILTESRTAPVSREPSLYHSRQGWHSTTRDKELATSLAKFDNRGSTLGRKASRPNSRDQLAQVERKLEARVREAKSVETPSSSTEEEELESRYEYSNSRVTESDGSDTPTSWEEVNSPNRPPRYVRSYLKLVSSPYTQDRRETMMSSVVGWEARLVSEYSNPHDEEEQQRL